MKKLSKIDRYIVIGSIGIFLISICVTFDIVLKQELKKEQAKITQQEHYIAETLNIKIWRHYHEEQMLLMQEVLKELKHQNNNSILNENIKANFQKPVR